MKISFVFPPFFLEPLYNLPPLGLMNLATVVQSQGVDAEIHDFVLDLRRTPQMRGRLIYDRCAENILAASPDVVAFSAQCTTYPGVVRIARKIRERDRCIKIVIGGHNASFADVRTLTEFPWIDAVIRGEGEVTIRELVERYRMGFNEEGILGVTWRENGNVRQNPDRLLLDNLDELPLPDYGLVAPLSEYRDVCGIPRSIAILEVGRGCPHQCVYCSESALWRRRSRTFSVDRLVREMRVLHLERGAECFLLAYDQFTADRSFVRSFCERILDEGLASLPWYCISRLDTVDADTLRLMRSAGCESMCYGIDSGSSRTLAFIGKRIDQAILYQRVRETTEEGMVPTLSFVIGFPEEEESDINATLLLALKTGIQGNSNPLIQMPTVLPGTRLHERYLPKLVREVGTYFSLGIEFDNGARLPDDDELINRYPDIFSSFYNLPCPAFPLSDLHQIVTFFPLVVNLYPKSFLLLCLSLQESVTSLFFRWMNWVKERESRVELILTAVDCYQHFHDFVCHLIGSLELNRWDHLIPVTEYETLAIRVAKPAGTGVQTNLHGGDDLRRLPLRSHNTLVVEFSKNLPAVISDLKAGVFKEQYPDELVRLVFHHQGNTLKVMEINDFGKDFIDLCNGERSLDMIAETLYSKYSAGLSGEEFFLACRRTAEELIEIKWLVDFELLAPRDQGRVLNKEE